MGLTTGASVLNDTSVGPPRDPVFGSVSLTFIVVAETLSATGAISPGLNRNGDEDNDSLDCVEGVAFRFAFFEQIALHCKDIKHK